MAPKSTDITGRSNESAITLLCTFGESVQTAAGEIVPSVEGFGLHVPNARPRHFPTASGAVEVLRRITKEAARIRKPETQVDWAPGHSKQTSFRPATAETNKTRAEPGFRPK